jgi:hypothetical protein
VASFQRTIADRIILDLCGGTGAWSQPYRKAGYDVRLITLPQDVRNYKPPCQVWGVLAAPPCTQFAISGARWWKEKPRHLLSEGLSIVFACLNIVDQTNPRWWALENPVGRLPQFIGAYAYTFQPWEYGNAWFKRTCIWGTARQPCPTVFEAPARIGERWRQSLTNHLSPTPTAEQIAKLVETGMMPPDWVHRAAPSPDRATLRSLTPPGFAQAFFGANP